MATVCLALLATAVLPGRSVRAQEDLLGEIMTIAAVRFEGRRRVGARELRSVMKTRPSSRWPWREKQALRIDFLRSDNLAIRDRYVHHGFLATGDLVTSVYRGMWLTVSRPLYYREYLGGPMFIAQAASEQARRGVDAYLQFLAMINVAIMAFNLLPIPVLDGGHITLALLQALRGQGISYRTYARFQKVGLAVIGTLFILILANDPLRWMQRQRALDKAPQEGKVAPNPP